MPQKFLLPSAEPLPGATWIPPGPIPRALRAFGKFPNLNQWRPADLLLVASITLDSTARQILSAQTRGGYAADDAQWQHAAAYIGEGYVMEATLHRVRYAPIYPYLGAHCLRLRRPMDLSDDDRWRIAIHACVRSNERYAMPTILRLFRLSFGGYWKRHSGFLSDMLSLSFALSYTRMPTAE